MVARYANGALRYYSWACYRRGVPYRQYHAGLSTRPWFYYALVLIVLPPTHCWLDHDGVHELGHAHILYHLLSTADSARNYK